MQPQLSKFATVWLDNLKPINAKGVVTPNLTKGYYVPTLAVKRYSTKSMFSYDNIDYEIEAHIERGLDLLELKENDNVNTTTFNPVDIYYKVKISTPVKDGKETVYAVDNFETRIPAKIHPDFDPGDNLTILADATHWTPQEFKAAWQRAALTELAMFALYEEEE